MKGDLQKKKKKMEEEGLENEKRKKKKKEEGWSGVEQSSDKRLFQENQGLRRSNPSLLVP
jgi:putative protein kinase ArgK-like GTPase of G3E family